MTTNNQDSPPPAVLLFNKVTAFMESNMIFAAVKLGLPDLFGDEPKSCEELAAKTGTRPDTLYRFLRALAAMGIFAEVGDQRFESTPMADLLRTDGPNTMADMALYFDSEVVRKPWESLVHSVTTGEDAFGYIFGEDHWSYFAKNQEVYRVFNRNMTNFTRQQLVAILEAYDFSKIHTLVDVGGGNGTLLSGVLTQYPAMRGILQDLASPIEDANEVLTATGVTDRCELVEGSFFDSVVQGGDAYILKWILHDWGDEDCLKILKTCRTAMGEGTRLLVIDAVVPPGNDPSFIKTMDIQMLVVNPGGRERTEAEFDALLRSAGFRIDSITPTQSPLSIVEALAI